MEQSNERRFTRSPSPDSRSEREVSLSLSLSVRISIQKPKNFRRRFILASLRHRFALKCKSRVCFRTVRNRNQSFLLKTST